MKVQITSVHFEADQKLLDYIQQSLDKLETHYAKITDGEVFLSLNNKGGIDDKTIEVKLLVPGTTLFSTEDGPSFEAATAAAAASLRRQITKHKEKESAY
ncbi:MAG: ribosome-associated translation inhibitor RaiA [Bacteroidota bacterium]|jgi:putative sigma-54 modulation protein|nr:ribosome-associated translation inhibitor RaiA [Bacteroidota bacterium]